MFFEIVVPDKVRLVDLDHIISVKSQMFFLIQSQLETIQWKRMVPNFGKGQTEKTSRLFFHDIVKSINPPTAVSNCGTISLNSTLFKQHDDHQHD